MSIKIFLDTRMPRNCTTFDKLAPGDIFIIGKSDEVYVKTLLEGEYLLLRMGGIFKTSPKVKVTILWGELKAGASARNALSYEDFLDKEGLHQ
jgi:hypothetical protein